MLLAQPVAAAPARISSSAVAAGPMRPWTAPGGRVRLLRPIVARLSRSDAALGALTTSGWRLVWDGARPTPGRMVVRLVLPVAPDPPETNASEVLQVGVGRGARTCLTYGLGGGSLVRGPDRTLGGRRYAVWTGGDAGMSQRVRAVELRTVAAGNCYAVARVGYGLTAGERDPAVVTLQARGAALLDAALDSLRIGAPSPRTAGPARAAGR